MLEILSRIANVVKNKNFDTWLEKMEKVETQKAKSRSLAKTLLQAQSIIRAKRKSTIVGAKQNYSITFYRI